MQTPIKIKPFESITLKIDLPYLGLQEIAESKRLNTTIFRVEKSNIYTFGFTLAYLNDYFHDLIVNNKTQVGPIMLSGENELFKIIVTYLSYGHVF